MKLYRIKGVLLQEMYITVRSVEIYFDVFIFSFISLLLFGFLSLYLTGSGKAQVAQFLVMGMLFWDILRVIQYSLAVGSMWNIWSRNLSNMFISPLSTLEYLSAHTFSGIIKASIVFCVDACVAFFVFHFNVFQLGAINILLAFGNLTLFAIVAGLVILAMIFRYGVRIQAFSWGILPVLQPLTASLFPVQVLPLPLQYFAYILPSTYVFEGERYSLLHHVVDWQNAAIALGMNIVYLIVAICFFNFMFYASKNSGQFARNEG